ncbi:MAG: hypothetical protein V1923_06255 [Candidatus Omnitrophota bacterium]
MEKCKYEFDPHNRLTVKTGGVRGIRKVLDGQFKISDHNTLTYHIKSSVPDGIKAPHQVKLKGTWFLTKDLELRLMLDKWRRQTFGDQLRLQGEIIDVRKNALLFALTTRTKDERSSLYALELCGSWQADAKNRLTFRVDKGRGRYDPLTLDGAWQINKNYQIIYLYKKEQLTQKEKKIQALTFKGYWDIRDKARLSYVLNKDMGSGFDFETSAGVFKKDYIKYELGIRVSGKKQPVKRTITFLGKWKVKKNAGLVFEIERGERKIQGLVFGAQARLTDKGEVLLSLRNDLNRGIGAGLELSRDIFKREGQAFLRLLQSKQESVLLIGSGRRW